MQGGAHLVYGRLARVRGDVRALAQQLRRAAPRLFGRDLGRRTSILPLAGLDEVVVGVSFAAALEEGIPFSSMDLEEERRRARGIDLAALLDARGDIEPQEREGWLCVLSHAPCAYHYLVVGLPAHLPAPCGFEELRRGERHWVGKRIVTLTPEKPYVWMDTMKRDAAAVVLRTFSVEAAVRDLVSLQTLEELAQRASSADTSQEGAATA
jgi:hypothetical protein